MMLCECFICIYNEEKYCTLKSISITGTGNCSECIFPNIDKNALDDFKKKTIQRLDESYNQILLRKKSRELTKK